MRDGLLVQQLACPRRTIRRTLRVADGSSFCFNCRLQWRRQHSGAEHSASARFIEQHRGVADLSRLSVYRAAVRAGFYSDWPVTPAR